MRKLRYADGSFRMDRKAVSPVIAVLLMIAVAVAAAILVYVWSMGLIGTLQTGGGQQVREQIELDAYSWDDAGDEITLYLRNVGAADVTVDALYVQGQVATTGLEKILTVQGPVEIVIIDEPGTFSYTAGVAYTLKIVTKTGGVFTFSIICGGGA